MKRLVNRINIGNTLLGKKIAIAMVLILMVVVPAVSVQGVSTMLTVNADPFLDFSSLTSSLNPSVYGDSVTFTAVVVTSGGAPTGKVIFVELSGLLGSIQTILGEDATAASLGGNSYEYTFSTSTLAIGGHAVFAFYDDGSGALSKPSVGPIEQMVAEKIWPTVTISNAPPQVSYSTQATFEFSSDTAGTVFECSLSESYDFAPENWTWSVCTSPEVYTGLLLDRPYWFAVRVQGAPITNSTMAVYQWYIGVPQISITGGPAQYIESTEATLTFSSNPGGVDLVCSLIEYDYKTLSPVFREEWVPCSSPRTYSSLSRGNGYYFSVKPAGVADGYAVSRQWSITRLTLTSSPNPSQFGSEVTFTATLWDDSGSVPAGVVSIMKLIYGWQGVPFPENLGSASGPTTSGTGSYIYTFSTSELAVGSHDIMAFYTVDEDTITSLSITQEVTEVTTQAPVIISQPENYTTCAGSSVSFTAAASGTPIPTVQWQVSNNGGTTWNNISGATTVTYGFTAAAGDNGKQYRAVFTNSAGSATSNAVILTVNTAPSVTTQPADQTVTYGAPSATFSAAASGTELSVRWLSITNGTHWYFVSGATTSNLTIANPTVMMSGTLYRAEFSNVCGTAISSEAKLTVNKAPVTATAGSYNGTYNGANHSPKACVVTGTYKGDLSCTNNPALVGPNVGSGVISPAVSGTGLENYAITSVNGAWSITPAPVTLKAGNYNGTYDGASHSPTACRVTGTYKGDLSCTNDPDAVGPNVGSGSVAPVLVLNGETQTNFTVTAQNGSWEITKAAATIVMAGYEGLYDGQPHGVTMTSTTGVNGEDLSGSVNVGTQTFTNVPGGQVAWSFEHNNYEPQNDMVDIVINKAAATIVVAGYEGPYEGQPHGATLTSATGVNGEDLSSSVTVGTQTFTNVPGGQVAWSFEHNNYVSQNGTVDIIITKADANIVVIGQTVEWDGEPHGAIIHIAEGVLGEDLRTFVNLGNPIINWPGGDVSWSFENINYKSQQGSVYITIQDTTNPSVKIGDTTYYADADHPKLGYIVGGYEKKLYFTPDDAASGVDFNALGAQDGVYQENDKYYVLIDTSQDSLEPLTQTLVVRDKAGNQITITFTYKVISMDDLLALLKPMVQDGIYRRNSTIPIKLHVFEDGNSAELTAPDDLRFELRLWQLVKGDWKQATINRTNQSRAGDYVFELKDGTTYQFNLKTNGNAVGQYMLEIFIEGKAGMDEGLVATVHFTLR